jgi:hypothetical protein
VHNTPIISIHLPENNYTFSVNTVLLSSTVAKPISWLIHGGYAARAKVLIENNGQRKEETYR